MTDLLLVWFPATNCVRDFCAKFEQVLEQVDAMKHATTHPTNAPLAHNSSRIPVIEPNEAGSVPPMSLSSAEKELRWLMEPREEGKTPDNWLKDTDLCGLCVWVGVRLRVRWYVCVLVFAPFSHKLLGPPHPDIN